MRTFQFWILLLASSFVSFLYIAEIFLTHNLIKKQQEFAESREAVTEGAQYETIWRQLAFHIYKASSKDPALVDILKKENIGIRSGPPAGAGSAPAPPASAAAATVPPATTPADTGAPASSQMPVTPPSTNTP
jgi:hypothetical protein